MVRPRIERLITALDVGSWKVCALIVGKSADGALHVLGSGQRESRGTQRGSVVDMDSIEQVVRETLEQAERIADRDVDDVWVAFTTDRLMSNTVPITKKIGGYRIEQEDINDLLVAGREVIDPDGRMILHALPTLYEVDERDNIKNPVGLYAEKLGVDIYVITADQAPVRNLETAVREAHLDVRAVVASPVASGLACLSDEERDLGVALVELGAEVTTISVYAAGMLTGLTALPFGASKITDDIASTFNLHRREAQRWQSFYGSALASPRDNNELIGGNFNGPDGLDGLDGSEKKRITRAQLIAVIRERLAQMMREIGRTLKELHFVGPVERKVVLVGGGADLKGIAEYTQAALGRSAVVGRPKGLIGLPEAHSGPAFATLIGTVLYAASNPVDLRDLLMSAHKKHRLIKNRSIQRLLETLRSSF